MNLEVIEKTVSQIDLLVCCANIPDRHDNVVEFSNALR